MRDLKGKWVLITGASSGFGKDYAHIFAKMGANLILTARRVERLESLKSEVSQQHKVDVRVIPCDLATVDGPQKLFDETEGAGIPIEVLINNAGFGIFGRFDESKWGEVQKMLQVDIVALTELTHLFLAPMKARNSGYIMLVSSIGAYQPSPTYAAYSAAKSYVLSFGEAINEELKKSNVKVSVLSPGVTKTEFLEVAGQKATFYQRFVMMKSYPVAMTGVRAMMKGKPSIVPGIINKVSVWSLRLVPRFMQAKLVAVLMK